jgi:four helix bundle protein
MAGSVGKKIGLGGKVMSRESGVKPSLTSSNERNTHMASFKKFEEIQAWQKARKATRKVYQATKQRSFARDFGLRDQIQRASVSIMANIAEGFGRHSDREFVNFLNIAHASVSEAQSHLYVSVDLEYI